MVTGSTNYLLILGMTGSEIHDQCIYFGTGDILVVNCTLTPRYNVVYRLYKISK